MEQITQPTILVIIGISGDLARRYTLPAIQSLATAGTLPDKFKIIGVSRRDIGLDEVLPEGTENLRQYLDMYQLDLADGAAYQAFGEYLQQIEQGFGEPAQRLFYLSVPPQVSRPIIEHLGASGLAKAPDTKLLLEKPFGTDLSSAQDLIGHIMEHFSEEQIYRVDHYLAKEMAQNLIVFRDSNALFRNTWNKDFIEKIDIFATENIDIEGRATFYEQTGALRDVLQSHLLQLAALTLMHETNGSGKTIPELRLEALKQLKSPHEVIRGQYEGYREQVQNADTTVETFVSVTLSSSDPRWEGVPISLTTGKALDKKATEIHIHYKQGSCPECNVLILRIQPNEGIELRLWVKEPGYSNKVQQLPLEFAYKNHFDTLPDAYERVMLDAMRGDHSLFTTGNEVLESWRLLQPVQQAWSMHSDDLVMYEPGSKPDDIHQS